MAFNETAFNEAITSFFDEPDTIDATETFEVFWEAYKAKGKLTLEQIDKELDDILEPIPPGLNTAVYDLLVKNSTPAAIAQVAPQTEAPVVAPAPIAQVAPQTEAMVVEDTTPIAQVTPQTEAPVMAPAPIAQVTPIQSETVLVAPQTQAMAVEDTAPIAQVTPIQTQAPVVAPAPIAQEERERKVKLAEVIAFVRKHRTSTLADFQVTVSNNLQPDNPTHTALSDGMKLSEYVGTKLPFQELIETVIAQFPDIKNNMTQSAMIQGLISPNEREQIKGLYQGLNIPRPEKKISKKRKAAPAERAYKRRPPVENSAPVENSINGNDRVMVTLEMMHRQIGTMHELLGNLLQHGQRQTVTEPASEPVLMRTESMPTSNWDSPMEGMEGMEGGSD